MVTKSQKPSQRALSNQRRREVRRDREANRHSMALRSSDSPKLAPTKTKDKPESVHSGDRTGIDEAAEAELGNDTDSFEAGDRSDEQV